MARNPWEGSTRRSRLPANWDELRADALERNPQQICHWCSLPGGTTLDHKKRGDDHRRGNLDWIHDRQDVEAGRSTRNCHGEKTSAEGHGARLTRNRPPDPHPALS